MVNYPIIQNDVAIGHTTVEAFAITIATMEYCKHELINNGLVLAVRHLRRWRAHGYPYQCDFRQNNPGVSYHRKSCGKFDDRTSNDLSGPTGNGLTGSDGLTSNSRINNIHLSEPGVDSLVIGSNYGNLFSYDESLVQNCSFEGWVVESAGTLVPGKGYMAYLTPGATIDLDDRQTREVLQDQVSPIMEQPLPVQVGICIQSLSIIFRC